MAEQATVRTRLNVPPVIFGTSSFGNLYRVMPEAVRLEVIGKMLEVHPGAIALDSAGKYGAGLALESLGKALSHFEVPADRVRISNKLGWRRVPLQGDEPTFEPGVWVGLQHDAVQDISYDGILRCWDEGNQLLGGYDAQLLSVHDPDEYLAAASGDADRAGRWNDILEAYKALHELRDRGLAQAIGVGTKDWRVGRDLVEACDLDWVMIAACFTVYDHDPELIQFIASLQQRGIAVINSAVFHGGFLTGGEFFNYRVVSRDSVDDTRLFEWRDRFFSLCKQFNTTPAEACVAFSMSAPGIVSIALNNSRAKWVEVNARLATVQLEDEFWLAMKAQGLIRADYPFVG